MENTGSTCSQPIRARPYFASGHQNTGMPVANLFFLLNLHKWIDTKEAELGNYSLLVSKPPLARNVNRCNYLHLSSFSSEPSSRNPHSLWNVPGCGAPVGCWHELTSPLAPGSPSQTPAQPLVHRRVNLSRRTLQQQVASPWRHVSQTHTLSPAYLRSVKVKWNTRADSYYHGDRPEGTCSSLASLHWWVVWAGVTLPPLAHAPAF